MIAIWILIYLVIGFGVVWVINKVYEEAFPDVMTSSRQQNEDFFEEIKESSKSEAKALGKYLAVLIVPGLIAWPVLFVIAVISSIRAKMSGR